MNKQSVQSVASQERYSEETVRPAILILVLVVAIIALPLGWLIQRIGNTGLQEADTGRYLAMASQVEQNVAKVKSMLQNNLVEQSLLSKPVEVAQVTLITPKVAPTNMEEAVKQDPTKLEIKLKAIYWSARDPLVTIGNENYREGEKINGFTIEEIRKTEVVFKNPYGDRVVKYFYEYLNQKK